MLTNHVIREDLERYDVTFLKSNSEDVYKALILNDSVDLPVDAIALKPRFSFWSPA